MNLKHFILISILLSCSALLVDAHDNNFRNASMYDEKPFTTVEKMPSYPGGDSALLKFISEKLGQPQEVIKDTIQRKVIVRFIVDSTGKISDCTVIQGRMRASINREIINVIESMPTWNPGMQNNRPVPVYFILPILYLSSEKEEKIQFYLNLGNNLFVEGKYEEAMEKYAAITLMDPDYTEAQLNYAAAQEALGRSEDAVENFERLFEISPLEFNSYAYNNRGSALSNIARYEEAIMKFEKALTLDPDFNAAYYNLAIMYNKLGLYQETINKLDQYESRSYSKVSPEVYLEWGNAYFHQGKYHKAIVKYDSVLQKQENDEYTEDVHLLIGTALTLNEEYDESIFYFEKVIEINPNNASAYGELANSLINLNRYDEAVKKLQQAIEKSPENNNYIITLANLYYNMGKEKKAIKLLEENKIENPKNYLKMEF